MGKKHLFLALLSILSFAIACGGGGGSSVSTSPSPTQTVSPSPTQTVSPTPTQTVSPTPTGTSSNLVVLGYNDLGMHCMNEDFSEFMILPPYNNLYATVIRKGGDPTILTSGVSITYSIPGNTTSSNKTNFWSYVTQLLGVSLSPDMGLAGKGLTGTMDSQSSKGRSDWAAEGIPVTPLNDELTENAYPLAVISASWGSYSAQTQAVVPVSWEISCNLCHNTAGISSATDILTKHDSAHGTNLLAAKPVLCGTCHAQAPLGLTGESGKPSLSSAMHLSHSNRMSSISLDVSCYACHPGVRTRCQRDIHSTRGKTCTDCHTSMAAVGNPARSPWVDEPRCSTCHSRSGYQFEQANTLYRNSKGHMGVHCAACHGSPHAITPSTENADNVQAIALQGHSGVISTCTVCHTSTPGDGFIHRRNDDKPGLLAMGKIREIDRLDLFAVVLLFGLCALFFCVRGRLFQA